MVSLRVFDEYGNGYASSVALAISYAQTYGIDILNLSASFIEGTPQYDMVFDTVISNYSGLFVTTAGNDYMNNDNWGLYPANYDCDNMIVVGSSNYNGNKSSFSNFSQTQVDLFAPGENIYSTLPNNSYGYMSGTSMAAPYVAGAAALLLSKNNQLTPVQLKAALMNNVDESSSLEPYCVSGGKLNIVDAMNSITHNHLYIVRYVNVNSTYHRAYCSCGEAILQRHTIDSSTSQIINGKHYARCKYCKALINTDSGNYPALPNNYKELLIY